MRVARIFARHALLLPFAFVALSPATALAFSPVFIANLVFTQRFKDVGSSTTAFAVNLLGAMVGGLLEYIALLTGYRALLLVVAVVYGAAFLTGRRYLGVRDTAAATRT